MGCEPCVKEIINSGARGLSKLAHKTAKRIPQMILDGQVTKERGERFLRELGQFEETKVCYGYDHLLRGLAADTIPVYDLPQNRREHRGGDD